MASRFAEWANPLGSPISSPLLRNALLPLFSSSIRYFPVLFGNILRLRIKKILHNRRIHVHLVLYRSFLKKSIRIVFIRSFLWKMLLKMLMTFYVFAFDNRSQFKFVIEQYKTENQFFEDKSPGNGSTTGKKKYLQ